MTNQGRSEYIYVGIDGNGTSLSSLYNTHDAVRPNHRLLKNTDQLPVRSPTDYPRASEKRFEAGKSSLPARDTAVGRPMRLLR